MVIWLVGMSGAGKTAIGRELHRLLKTRAPNTVFVDGDEIRAVFKHDRGDEAYTVEGRRVNTDRLRELCAWLDRQDLHVVCCTLSVFEDALRWNRENLSRYYEVYVSVPIDVLRRRDQKNLYAPAFAGETSNVVGVDLPFSPPPNPDYVLDNSADGLDFEAAAADILWRAEAG
ncbi:MAG: adenylyl-sulfate kinase [Acidimicrobiaceae bacterium]|nr:adenylyl-sulfate kinase [Acidimicrobiaceae bacterium]|tara:strand:+ start:330 stop:848 length:519 start_codon:yes stop_codon:yes gene_type:complete